MWVASSLCLRTTLGIILSEWNKTPWISHVGFRLRSVVYYVVRPFTCCVMNIILVRVGGVWTYSWSENSREQAQGINVASATNLTPERRLPSLQYVTLLSNTDYVHWFSSIELNSCLLTCWFNSQVANNRNSTTYESSCKRKINITHIKKKTEYLLKNNINKVLKNVMVSSRSCNIFSHY
jgi:hypothetical protein